MSQITGISEAMFVVDGATPAPEAAAVANTILGPHVTWTIVVVMPEDPHLTSGATGFAAPVMSPDEMESQAAADLVTGDGTAATTARGFGDRPVTQTVVRGEPVGAIQRFLDDAPTELVVVASPDLAEGLADSEIAPILVVPASFESLGGPVLLAVDGSESDDAITSTAARLLDPSTTEYVAVNVEPIVSTPARSFTTIPPAPISAGPADTADTAQLVADDAVAQSEVADATSIGTSGDPAARILATAAEHNVSMIILGTHDRGWLSRIFRPSVSHAVLQDMERPVLVMTSGAVVAPLDEPTTETAGVDTPVDRV